MYEKLASTIKNNKIAVIPTDTLYGIVANPFSKQAVSNMYTIKGRDEDKPFIILIKDILDLKDFGVVLTQKHKLFLDKNWPGAISIILPVKSKKLNYLHRGTYSLAFRMPKKKKIKDILSATGPLVAPSANPQGKKSAETISEAKKYFNTLIDCYVSSGRLTGSPSTLVSFLSKDPIILRQGLKKVIF